MNSFLKIYRSPELPDFKKSGYFSNIKTALQFAPSVRLLPFFERLQTYTGISLTVQLFYLEGLDCKGNVVSTHILDGTKIDVSIVNSQVIISYDGGTDLIGSLASFQQGVYQYSITMSSEKTYKSEPFEITYSKFIPILGDFDPLDFNDDFFTTG